MPTDRQIPAFFTYPTVFYVDGKELVTEEALLPMPIGTGAVWGDGTRYPVADTWLSFDHRGRFDLGAHVFLERVERGSEGDTLFHLAPDYFVTG